MELLDIVDENNNLIGKCEERRAVHEIGLWHREIAIWIINENNEILVQKRSATKEVKPNKWSMTAGHIDSGEEPIEAAIREANEELGLKLDKSEIKLLFIDKVVGNSNNKINKHFKYQYLVKTNTKINEYVIQEEELSEVKYITLEELEKIVEEKNEDYTFSKQEYMKEIIPVLKNNM